MSRGSQAVNVVCAVIGIILLVLAVTGCQPGQGLAGVVVDRDKRALTVRQPDGSETRFTVTKKTARSCPEGAAYPQCADNPSWTRRR